jgi:DNA-binding NtrC family response regulator
MKKILIADDVDSVRKITLLMLKHHFKDYEIETFEDGSSLNGRLEKDVSDVSLIVTDNSMPGMKGSEIISKYAGKLNIPFILAYADDESIGEKAVEDGAYAFIIKPFNMSDLISLAERAMNR